ncbi:alpha/beta fold hydrolase [bacterium]|nr:alpha/beta fold hydrolase [Rubripirellula sp.]MDA7936747.1 alpha/beta fold hydrolase [bacterium]MDB4644524.1 alpha/beta fold hydrolase [Rubripirellula sp.]
MPEARRTRIASLDCIVVDGGDEPSIGVVICHGYGASYDDLAGLSNEWLSLLGDQGDKFRFVFPDAPNSLAEIGMPQGRAWWPINMARLAEAVQASDFEELHEHEPPGVTEARLTLCDTITSVKQELGGDATPLVLGGFSQGAMLAMDTALRGSVAPPQLLIQFSGTVICRPQWQQAMSRLSGTEVFQSHGTIDPVLPYASASILNEMLQNSGVSNRFHSFEGPHTIDLESVTVTAELLRKIAAS